MSSVEKLMRKKRRQDRQDREEKMRLESLLELENMSPGGCLRAAIEVKEESG